MTKLAPLTPAISEFHPLDEWRVVVNKKQHSLNGKEIQILKEATTHNFRGIIWFKTFALSIPHIQEIYRVKSGKKEEEYRKKYLKKS